MLPRKTGLLIALVALIGVGNFAYSFATPLIEVVWNGYESPHWPKASGQITSAEVRHDRKGRPYALIEYRYSVHGQVFSANTLRFASPRGDMASAQAVVRQFPPGPVQVHYKPTAPEQAVLMPGLHSNIPLLILVGGSAAVLLALFVFLRLALRLARPSPHESHTPWQSGRGEA